MRPEVPSGIIGPDPKEIQKANQLKPGAKPEKPGLFNKVARGAAAVLGLGTAAAGASEIACGPRAAVVQPTSTPEPYKALLPVSPKSPNTPTPKPTETPAPPPTAESTKTPTPLPTPSPIPSPTELPKTPTKVPVPEDNISKETAQFAEWSPQKVDQALHEAWEKGEFKTVINWDVNREGWELKKIKAPWIKQGPPETLALFLPEGEVFTFSSPLTERVYAANTLKEQSYIEIRKDNNHIGISYGFSPNGELFFKGGPNLEINPTPKVGEPIFRLQFESDSPQQKIFETASGIKGVGVFIDFIDPIAKTYRGVQPKDFLTDE
ncbi:hypothetical protein KKE03_01395, partial [Patescibacteria group bacterium]|nr:hypothetical protein [Patescibacteria group bacterium]